jgi:hypothetical protein
MVWHNAFKQGFLARQGRISEERLAGSDFYYAKQSQFAGGANERKYIIKKGL